MKVRSLLNIWKLVLVLCLLNVLWAGYAQNWSALLGWFAASVGALVALQEHHA